MNVCESIVVSLGIVIVVIVVIAISEILKKENVQMEKIINNNYEEKLRIAKYALEDILDINHTNSCQEKVDGKISLETKYCDCHIKIAIEALEKNKWLR